VLAKKGPLGKIWLAAHMEKKVPKVQIMSTNIPESVDNIENPDCPMALRVSGHLLLGVVRIFSRKVSYLMSDCSEAIVKIKDAFAGPGVVHLAPGASTRRYDEITNPEGFDEMDLDTALPSQAFARNEDDDLLAGMSLPEGAFGDVTLVEPQFEMEGDMALDGGFGGRPAFGDDGYGAEEPEAVSGFGVNDNIEVFQAPLEPPSAKRARRSPVPALPEEEEEEMEVERMRSAVNGASPVGVNVGGAAPSDMPELPLGPDPELDFEPPRFDEGDAQLDQGLNAAVVDEFDIVRRTSMDHALGTPALPPPHAAEEGQPSRRPKRKMVFDAELQISAAQVREPRWEPAANPAHQPCIPIQLCCICILTGAPLLRLPFVLAAGR
jgi:cohesin complex subunit SCC1